MIPYNVRIFIFVALSACGMLVIALTPPLHDSRSISIKMFGVILASLSSGAGELSFLGLTHFYGHFALAAWGSGTGGAGLIGAGAYAIATTTLQISVRTSLLAFSVLPVVMILSFYLILPHGPLASSTKFVEYEAIQEVDHEEQIDRTEGGLSPTNEEHHGLLASSIHHSPRSFTSLSKRRRAWASFKANLRRSRGLFFPFMLPLLLVYIAGIVLIHTSTT
jgi:battenin